MKTMPVILITLAFILQAVLLVAVPAQSDNYTDGRNVRCTAVQGDNLWIGTSGGLVKMNRFTNQMTFYNALNSGLPDNMINSITIDALGVKWIGTCVGLVRFDGQNWDVYDPDNSGMGNPNVYTVEIDAQGTKWIGSRGCLMKFDGTTWTNFNTFDTHLQSKNVTSIAVDSEGVKWIGTAPISTIDDSGSGLVRFDGTNWSAYTTSDSDIGADTIRDIFIDGMDKIWMCHPLARNEMGEITGGGLSCMDGTAWTVYTNATSGLPVENLNCISVAPNGIMWIGTDAGLVRFVSGIGTVFTAPAGISATNTFSNISIDSEGIMWLGNDGIAEHEGLMRFTGITWSAVNPSNSGIGTNYVNCLAIDANQTKWMGTNAGLVSFDGLSWGAYTTQNSGIPYGSVNCMAIDSLDVLWLGIGHNLVSYNGTFWNIELEYSSDITSIVVDHMGVKWLGVDDSYYGCLLRYNGSNTYFYNDENSGLPGRQVTNVAADAVGKLWISTRNDIEANGVTSFDGTIWENFRSTNSLLPGNEVYCVAVDSLGVKWIGTNNGLASYGTPVWTVYNSTNSSLPYNSITALVIDAQGNKWMSAKGYDPVYLCWRSVLVRYAGNTWEVFDSAVPQGRFFDELCIDAAGVKWLASQDDALGLISYYQGDVHSEDDILTVPVDRYMLGSYPNPFASRTNITFNLDKSAPVELKIYNLKGQLVKMLHSGVLTKGQQLLGWDGTDGQNRKTAQGVYLCRLSTPEGSSTRKLIRLK